METKTSFDDLPKRTILATLFVEMFKIALFVVGGGFAILAVADDVFSRKLRWTAPGEIIDQMPLFQMIPGIIAGHTAIYVGHKAAGVLGAAIALLGTLIPSIAVFSVITAFYHSIPVDNHWMAAAFTGLRAALAGIIAAMIVRDLKRHPPTPIAAVSIAISTFLIGFIRIDAAIVIFAAAIVGIALAFTPKPGKRVFRSAFWTLPLVFLKYGLVAFGGGYVLVPLYLNDFVGPAAPLLKLSPHDFANVMSLTQMTPGPIGVNCATFFGYRIGGVLGATIATVSLVLPGFVLMLVFLKSLDRFRSSRTVIGLLAGVRPTTTALMLVAFWTFASVSAWRISGGHIAIDWMGAILVVAACAMTLRKSCDAVRLVVGCAGVAVAAHAVRLLLFA